MYTCDTYTTKYSAPGEIRLRGSSGLRLGESMTRTQDWLNKWIQDRDKRQ